MLRLGYYLHGNSAHLQGLDGLSTASDQSIATRGLTAEAVDEGTMEGVVGPPSSASQSESQNMGYRASGLDNGSWEPDSMSQSMESAAAAGDGRAPIHNFKESRMLAGGVDNSTKLSAFLAAVCISPRMVHAAVTAAAGEGSEHLCHRLLWRRAGVGVRRPVPLRRAPYAE